MRKILFTIMACMTLSFLTSCLDFSDYIEENKRVPESPKLSDAQYVTSTSAYLEGQLKHYTRYGTFYFQVSETQDFANPQQYDVKGIGGYQFYYTIYDLKPATTYYYKLVGTDGYATVSSEVKSFTTLKGFELGKITYTDWDGTIKEVADSMMPLGISLFTNGGDEDYWNMSVSKKNGKWKLPYDFSITTAYGTPYYCTVYSPYSKGSFKNVEKGMLQIGTYKNGPYYYKYMDYLTGSAEISENSDVVNINLTHALARVRFHFTSSYYNMGIENLQIQQDATQKVIPTIFRYDMRGTGSVFDVNEFSDIDYGGSFEIIKNETTDITILSGPTRASGTVTLWLLCSDGTTVTLPIELKADSWKSGGTYDYNITYDKHELYITDVKVTEWNNNQGGNINIYDK